MPEYQGKKVQLEKPRYIREGEPGYGKKKFVVYVKKGDRVVRVTYGDPNMRIKKSIPERRSNFRSRHGCKNPGPKHGARYWSCKAW